MLFESDSIHDSGFHLKYEIGFFSHMHRNKREKKIMMGTSVYGMFLFKTTLILQKKKTVPIVMVRYSIALIVLHSQQLYHSLSSFAWIISTEQIPDPLSPYFSFHFYCRSGAFVLHLPRVKPRNHWNPLKTFIERSRFIHNYAMGHLRNQLPRHPILLPFTLESENGIVRVQWLTLSSKCHTTIGV